MDVLVDCSCPHVVGLKSSHLVIVVKLVDSSPHGIVHPLSLAALYLTSLEAAECPLTTRSHPLVALFRCPLLLYRPEQLRFLDDEHAASVPDVLQHGHHFSLVGRLKLQELVDLHCVDSRSWLIWMPLYNKLAKISEL